MKAYDVFMKLVQHGRQIGLICVNVTANSPFNAALLAEREIDKEYGQDVYGQIAKVVPATMRSALAA